MPTEGRQTPTVVWRGSVPGDGTGHQPSYYVRLYRDGTATCECRAWYMRGLERQDLTYRCKHVRRAIAAHAPDLPDPRAGSAPDPDGALPPAATPAEDLAVLSATELRRARRRAFR